MSPLKPTEETTAALAELCDRFRQNLPTYKALAYKEAKVRVDFLNPLFELIGWDVRNTSGKAEQYRDVVSEDSVEIEGHQKAPDYSFRIGGVRKFFVEAKKPAVNLHDNIAPSLQVRRYSYSARLPLAILTDFEEFAVFDTRVKPHKEDKAATARIFYCTFEDYLKPLSYGGEEYATHFDFICSIFSREAIEQGSFDHWASDNKRRGTSEVDREFLQMISAWREELAKNIAARNLAIGVRDLNLAVQRIIDRLVFLRFAEDRGAEQFENLKGIALDKEKHGVHAELAAAFEAARVKYNSDLFEKNAMLEALALDDKVLSGIIKSMYYPDCPYEFSVMPLEILGSAYEQFLGKTIRVEGGEKRHRAVIEEKPEVRKAGGVYYTPQYIVDYIVTETVGKKLEGATPESAASLRIVDPACGSGSFLIGVYTRLLDWYQAQYTRDEAAVKKALRSGALFERASGDWRLTLEEKRRILTTHIHGVDIDAQAVEVTKLSLFLKLLEDGGMIAGQGTLALAHDKILPNLDANIKCGNSLIGPDYYDDKELSLFADDDMTRINAFDWHAAFPEVFKAGGFDCVVGNPPYVRQELLGDSKPYFEKHYKVYHGMADLYAYFFEKGIGLLKKGGRFGIIVANKWMRANYGGPLRTWLRDAGLETVIDFGDLPVFKDATTYPCIMVLERGKEGTTFRAAEPEELAPADLSGYLQKRFFTMQTTSLDPEGWTLMDEASLKLLEKLKKVGTPLGEYVGGKIYYGIKTGLNEAFVVDRETKDRLIAEDPRSAEVLKPFLAGRDIKRYEQPVADKWLIFFPKGWTAQQGFSGRGAWAALEVKYPAIARWLAPLEEAGKKRCDQGDYWWELRACDYYGEFEKPKMMLPDISLRGNFILDETGGWMCANTCYILCNAEKWVLAIMNSNLLTWSYGNISTKFRGGYLRYFIQYMEILPLPIIDANQKAELDKLVDSLINLNKEDKLTTGSGSKILETRIAATDRQIDQLVYKLYGLTEEEIGIVEGAI